MSSDPKTGRSSPAPDEGPRLVEPEPHPVTEELLRELTERDDARGSG